MQYVTDGFIVVGDVSIDGCTKYRQEGKREKIQGESLDGQWLGFKHVTNISEHKKLRKVRSEAHDLLRKVGVSIGGYGWIVPAIKSAELRDALAEIDALCVIHNAAATCTSARPASLVLVIRGDDEQVARIVYGKVADALNDAVVAIDAGDVRKLRSALSELKGVDSVLGGEAPAVLTPWLDTLRKKAKEAVQAAKKATEGERPKIISDVLKSVGVDGIRLQFVEIAERKFTEVLPAVDARQVE